MPEHCACKTTESAFADKQHDKMHRVPHHITIAFLATFLTSWIKDVTYAKKQNKTGESLLEDMQRPIAH